ncbi:MAG TPA: hypothetical protein VIY68_06245 [Steroidobacteraceae bacterium]
MQCVNLSDDELWNAIAENADALSDLLHQRAEVENEINGMSDPASRTELMSSYVGAVNKFESEYRTYTAEIRRRYPA